jgi:hypothetical protein
MSEQHAGGRDPAALRAAGVLGLAAAPTFACMALLTSALGGGAMDVVCAAAKGPLGGMAAMYWLMSAFHLGPWLKLIATRRSLRPS